MQHGGGSRFPVSLPSSEFGVAFLAPAPEPVAPINAFNELSLEAVEDEQGMVGSISPGNRWPRQETSALLTIRSDMNAAFRGANLKTPLWDEVSRRLRDLGYCRSAKKCREKFENVYKYYNRTKDARAGRQDGKCYRFFSQLKVLHCSTSLASAIPGDTEAPVPVSRALAPPPSSDAAITAPVTAATAIDAFDLSSSSKTSSYSGTDSEEKDEEPVRRKRKREGADGGEETPNGRQKLMSFFEVVMQQVLERQEALQNRFLEAIERREQHRLIREEAWRRQDVNRIVREQELAAQERAAAARRGEAIVAFLQKLTGQKIPIPPPPHAPQTTTPAAAVPSPEETPTCPPHQALPTQTSTEIITNPPEHQKGDPPQEHQPPPWAIVSTESGPARWPKSEVHALIKLRSGMEARYLESGPKGPLWEDISEGMRRLGYNRSSKRCKEKWENINKYFKKVKETNKKRAEDDKTCPYFPQLDAFYSRKLLGNAAHTNTVFCAPDADPKFAALPAAASPPLRPKVDTSMLEEGGVYGGFSLGFYEEGHSSPVAVKHMSLGES